MADTDQSLNNLRYNQVTQGLEGFGGGSPMWTPLVLTADGGITQLTGDVTAGPGTGSQAATLSPSAAVKSIHADSQSNLTGAVQLVSGTNITLSQVGQAITVNASGGGSGITQLTGAVTAGPGSGSQAANVAYIVGVTDGSNAAAGNVGEIIASAFSNASAVGGAAWSDLASVALTPGDWQLSLTVVGNVNQASITLLVYGITDMPGNNGGGMAGGVNQVLYAPSSADTPINSWSIATYNVTISSPDTYYVKHQAVFSSTAPMSSGILSARRMR